MARAGDRARGARRGDGVRGHDLPAGRERHAPRGGGVEPSVRRQVVLELDAHGRAERAERDTGAGPRRRVVREEPRHGRGQRVPARRGEERGGVPHGEALEDDGEAARERRRHDARRDGEARGVDAVGPELVAAHAQRPGPDAAASRAGGEVGREGHVDEPARVGGVVEQLGRAGADRDLDRRDVFGAAPRRAAEGRKEAGGEDDGVREQRQRQQGCLGH